MKKPLSFHDIKQQLTNPKSQINHAKIKSIVKKRNSSLKPSKAVHITKSNSLSPNIALKTDKPSKAVVFMNKHLVRDLQVGSLAKQ